MICSLIEGEMPPVLGRLLGLAQKAIKKSSLKKEVKHLEANNELIDFFYYLFIF